MLEVDRSDGVLLLYAGLTFTHKVSVCARVGLVAKMVIGTLCDLTEVDEVRVSTGLPLERYEELNAALTPAGSPLTDNCTGPKLKDFNCRGIVSLPALIE